MDWGMSKRKTIAQLETELADVRKTSDDNYASARDWRAKAQSSEKALEEAWSHFADLKKKLYDAEMQNARNAGYLQRVSEDDAVADPLVEIDGPNGKRMVSKRYPSQTMVAYDATQDSVMGDLYSRREKPKHWTGY
jgi:hypothetical protein